MGSKEFKPRDVKAIYETGKIDKIQDLPGDVNGNGEVTATDARIILQYVAGIRDLSEKEFKDVEFLITGKAIEA